MKISSAIIPTSIIFLFGISFYGRLLNTVCGSSQGCNDLESLKTIILVVIIIDVCAILCIFVNGFYNSKELKITSKAPIIFLQKSDDQ